ncbi:ATP-binding protein [Streptomyces sp. NPDC059063]|uniref:ATP-binding protein n=1 Tax=unclassified Streptomyces TaxID=2593676 RepID=UPI0036A33DAC
MLGNPPEERDSFIGRRAERARLAGTLGPRTLTTLTGAGGVGKSRLAAHTLRRLPAERRAALGEVRWADLSALPDEGLLITAVADAVGLADHTPRLPLEALRTWLAPRRVLLVLDSCEHLVAACRDLVGELLAGCPGLTVLTTSRQPLGLWGEARIEVRPLAPDGDALTLFTERAEAVAPGTLPDEPHRGAAATEICERLDGIPLALELAAAQLRHTPLDELADRLRAHHEGLVAAAPLRPARHRTLRTTIGWSHELCEPLERLLWARLSILRGPFDEDTARGVCGGGPLSGDAVTTALFSLVAKSVVSLDGQGRYRLPNTVREYGLLWLGELDEHEAAADRHAAYFLGLARAAEAAWLGPEQVAWYGRVAAAHTDLCAALDHLALTDTERALELVGLVAFFWSCCGHLHEARAYLEQLLVLREEPCPARDRALWALGVVALLQGEHDRAEQLGLRCAREAARSGDAEQQLAVAYLLGITHLLTGRAAQALDTADRTLARVPGPPFRSPSRLRCHLVKVFALTSLGRLDEARRRATALREGCIAHGECWTRAYCDYLLSLIALGQQRPARAAEHARAMLAGKRLIGDSFGIALGMDLLAAAAAAEGRAEVAAVVCGTSETLWQSVGHTQRGMPELREVREQCRRLALTAVGREAFERAFQRGAGAEPGTVLTLALEGRLSEEV